MKWECGSDCSYEWFCSPTSEDPDAVMCSSSTYAGFPTDTPCTTSSSSRSRVVECRALELDGAFANYTAAGFCSETQPTATGSNMCVYDTQCDSGSGFGQCEYTCGECVVGPGAPVGTMSCVDGNGTAVTDPELTHLCAPDDPTDCYDPCRAWFCAPAGTDPDTNLSVFESCAYGDAVGYFAGPEPSCHDEAVERVAQCARYALSGEDRTPEAVAGSALCQTDGIVDPDTTRDAVPCPYWRCVDEGFFGECTDSMGACVADQGNATECFVGHHDIPVGCYYNDGTAAAGCDPDTKPTGAVCIEDTCAFEWWCSVDGADSPFVPTGPCGQVCSAAGNETVAVTASCRAKADGTEASGCEAIYGSAPTTAVTAACEGSWYCGDGYGNYVDCATASYRATTCLPHASQLMLTDTCYDGIMDTHFTCLSTASSAALTHFQCPAAQPSVPDQSAVYYCAVYNDCPSIWATRAPGSEDTPASTGQYDKATGFPRLCRVGDVDPEEVTRELLCVDSANLTAILTDADCLTFTRPVETTSVSTLCSPWSASMGTCVWDGSSCDQGSQVTTSVCNAGYRMCDPDVRPEDSTGSCTLSYSRCFFACFASDAELADITSGNVDNQYCDGGGGFPDPPVPACYSQEVTRQVFCFDPYAYVMHNDTECAGDKPAATGTMSDDSACAFEYRCAPEGTTDFVSAPLCTASTGWGACTVDCTSASKRRSVACVNADMQIAGTLDRCPGERLPSSVAECVAEPTISAVALTATHGALVAGTSMSASFCYYGVGDSAADINMLAYATIETDAFTYRAGAGTMLSGSVLLDIPTAPPVSSATLRISTKGGKVSAALSTELDSQCDHALDCGSHGTCDAASSSCVCRDGYSGSLCTVSPCDALDCISDNLSVACVDTAPACACKTGFSGSRCEVSAVCSAALDCQHGGYVHASGVSCAAKCTCSGNWSGTTCSTCGLSCDSGKPNDDCTACVCPRGTSGSQCQCPELYGTLVFPGDFDPSASLFQWAFKADVSLLAGMDQQDITLYHYGDKLVIALRSCDSVSSVSALQVAPLADDMASAWSAVTADMESSDDSLLFTGSLKGVSGVSAVHSLYDPSCTGSDCAEDPFPEEEVEHTSGGGGLSETVVIVIAVLASAVAIAAVLVGAVFMRRHLYKQPLRPLYDDGTEMSDANRTSIYARASMGHTLPADGWYGRPDALTTDDVVLAINARNANSPPMPMTSLVDGGARYGEAD